MKSFSNQEQWNRNTLGMERIQYNQQAELRPIRLCPRCVEALCPLPQELPTS